MFEYFTKQSKLYTDLENKYKYLLGDRDTLEHAINTIDKERVALGLEIAKLTKALNDVEVKSGVEIAKLNEELKAVTAAGGVSVKEGNSTVTFEFDKELNITVKSRINEDIIPVLIDKKYIEAEHSADESTIQFAFILLANESSEQIIVGTNENED